MNDKNFKWVIFWIITFILTIIIFSSFYVINPWEVWLVKRLWELDKDYKTEWLHWKVPFIESVTKMSIKNKKLEWVTSAASKDLQSVSTSIAVNYSIIANSSTELYANVWIIKDIESVLINPAIDESVKASTSLFNASELITKRKEVNDEISKNLKNKLFERWILINDLNIIDFQFSKEFDRSIEEKVTAEQKAFKAEKDLERVKFEAQQQIERSKAEAEKIKIQAEAIMKQWWEEYVKLQWIAKWNWTLPTHVLWEDSNLILNMK